MPQPRRLHGVLVTYRRRELLMRCLDGAVAQRTTFESLIVIDNSPSDRTRAIVEGYGALLSTRYVPAPENLGPAGGYAMGMELVLAYADDEDLLALLDDNDPLPSRDVLGELSRFLDEIRHVDRRTIGVAVGGGTFDWRRLVVRGLDHSSLDGPVRVDHLHGNAFPVYLVGGIRSVGTYDATLFFGFEELEYGLRVTRRGESLYVHGALAFELREHLGGKGAARPAQRRLGPVGWRRYYSLRNIVYILLRHHQVVSAFRVATVRGIGKPLANFVLAPRLALRHLVLNGAAIRDAALGRMGRTVDPDSNYF